MLTLFDDVICREEIEVESLPMSKGGLRHP
jgi:hypothetical protein